MPEGERATQSVQRPVASCSMPRRAKLALRRDGALRIVTGDGEAGVGAEERDEHVGDAGVAVHDDAGGDFLALDALGGSRRPRWNTRTVSGRPWAGVDLIVDGDVAHGHQPRHGGRPQSRRMAASGSAF